MIKFVGIIILLISSSAIGAVLSYKVKGRVEDMIYIKKLMIMFRGELNYKNSMLPDAFTAVSAKAKSPYNLFFSSLAKDTEENFSKNMTDVFADNVDKYIEKNTYLKQEDLEKLKEIGDTLGYQDKKMQISNIDLYIERLSDTIEESREKMGEQMKVYRTLAMMAGILISIILW